MNTNDDYILDRTTPVSGIGGFAENFDLQYYVRTLRRWKSPIIGFVIFSGILATYYAYTATPIYSATATLLIEQQTPTFVAVEDLYGSDTDDKDYYQTQFEILKSTTLAERVVNELDLWSHELLAPEPDLTFKESIKQTLGSFRQKIDSLIGSDISAEVDDGATKAVASQQEPTRVGSSEESTNSFDVPLDVELITPNTTSNVNGEGTGPQTLVFDDTMFPGGNTMPNLNLPPEVPEGSTTPEKVEAPNLDVSSDLPPVSNDSVLAEFGTHLKIIPIRKTKLVKLSFESPDPEFSALIANAVGEQYITSYLDARLERTIRASAWLDERLVDLKLQLDNSESALIAFKNENELVDVAGSVGRLNEQALVSLSNELVSAQSELSRASELFQTIQSLSYSQELLESLPVMLLDPLMQRAKIEDGNARRDLDQLLNRYGELHPRVVDVRSRLKTLDQTKDGHIERIVQSVSQKFQLSQQRVLTIEEKLEEGKRGIQELGVKRFELDSLEREVSTNQNIYERFFNRITEASSIDGMDISNARISDRARVPGNPIKPRKQLIIVFSLLAATALSMVLAFVYETLDDTIKGANDVEQEFGVKFIGLLPIVKNKGLFKFRKGRSKPLTPHTIRDAKGVFLEAVNTVRTSICIDDVRKKNKVILITSSVPAEGKSTAAVNLAYSFAQLERVLLIDADLRRPSIATSVGITDEKFGLSSLIAKQVTAYECIYQASEPGLADVLTCGPIPNQPLEVLSSPRLETLINQLSDHYDRIIIDTAPVQAVSDALVLSRLCDSVVYVVKSHSTSIDMVRRGLMRLQEVEAPLAGVVVTQVDVKKISKYGGDHFYQGYFDRYGYGKGQGMSPKIKFTNEELMQLRTDKTELELGFE